MLPFGFISMPAVRVEKKRCEGCVGIEGVSVFHFGKISINFILATKAKTTLVKIREYFWVEHLL